MAAYVIKNIEAEVIIRMGVNLFSKNLIAPSHCQKKNSW